MSRKLVHGTSHSLTEDFSLFRRYPFLETDLGEYVGYDGGFLLKLLSEGIYWLLFE